MDEKIIYKDMNGILKARTEEVILLQSEQNIFFIPELNMQTNVIKAELIEYDKNGKRLPPNKGVLAPYYSKVIEKHYHILTYGLVTPQGLVLADENGNERKN